MRAWYRKFVRHLAGQFIRRLRFTGFLSGRRNFGSRISGRIFRRRLGWLARLNRRIVHRSDRHCFASLCRHSLEALTVVAKRCSGAQEFP